MGRSQDGLELNMDNVSIAGSAESLPSTEKEPLRVLSALTTTVERLVSRNERSIDPFSTSRVSTLYDAMRLPGISVGKYLRRINRYTCCSPSCFVLGFVYIDQLVHKQPDFPLISLNIHRLLLTSIMVATKFLDDMHYNNDFYAKVGGISVHELNILEIDFLFKLKFKLNVAPVTFQGYQTHLERELSLAEGQKMDRKISSYQFVADYQQDEESDGAQDAHRNSDIFEYPSFLKQTQSPTMWVHSDE